MNVSKALLVAAVVAAFATSVPVFAQQVTVDAKIPAYKSVQGVSGTIKSVGSDTMNNEMTLWAEGFKAAYPNIQIEIEGKGSSTAPPALVSGASQFGPMSRPLKDEEIAAFKAAFGYEPTTIPTSIDALAVFVHKDNPIKSLTFKQLDGIFSKTHASGGGDVVTWGDLGLAGEWKDKPISLYGRNSASGTYGYFKEHALGKKDFKPDVKEQPGSSAVIQAVASDKYAMGYSGIGYATADVKAVPLAAEKGGKAFDANAENAYAGDYPLSRFLFVYVNVKPGAEPTPLVKEFMRMVLSQQGQQTTVKYAYYPIPNRVAQEGLKAIGSKVAEAQPAAGKAAAGGAAGGK